MVRASIYVFLVVLLSGILLHLVETYSGSAPDDSPYRTLAGTMWEVAVFLFSGYDATPPSTTIGRVLSFVCLFSGIALVLMLTADLSSQLVATALAGRGRQRIRTRNHIVLCGWHYTAHALVQQLISRERNPRREIVVIDDKTEVLQVYDPDVHLVRGDPTDLEVLERANAGRAHTAIIPIDWKLDEEVQDSRTTLAAMAVRSLNENIYTCVEVLHPQNKRHIQRTGVEEVICLGDFSQRMIASAAVAHGLSRLLDDVLTFNLGSEIYRVPLPPVLAGKSFRWLLKQANEKLGAVLLSVQRGDAVHTNPPGEFILEEGDQLFVLSVLHPERLSELAGRTDC